MALPFIAGVAPKKIDQIVAVDLGSRNTKAVHLQRQGQALSLHRFAVVDAPIFDKVLSPELLAEHLRSVVQTIAAKTRFATLSTNPNDVLVRPVEMPRMPVEDMRLILKHNSRNYLQQDLANYVFDCHVLPSSSGGNASQKQKVLVAGARSQLVEEYVSAARSAGLLPVAITPSLVGPVNAFEFALPDAFACEVVAVVDLGFRTTTISILQQGELALNRVVAVGADRLTTSVAETMNISYAEAEGIKLGMPSEVISALESVLVPLGRELRASIDFYEHQQDRPVAAVYLTGGSARSEFILQLLQQELMVETRTWNPTSFLKLELSPEQAAEIEHVAPQLATAIGLAVATL